MIKRVKGNKLMHQTARENGPPSGTRVDHSPIEGPKIEGASYPLNTPVVNKSKDFQISIRKIDSKDNLSDLPNLHGAPLSHHKPLVDGPFHSKKLHINQYPKFTTTSLQSLSKIQNVQVTKKVAAVQLQPVKLISFPKLLDNQNQDAYRDPHFDNSVL